MKKNLSVAFVVVLLLNVMGYYGVFLGLDYQNDREMAKVLDSDVYDESQTITVRIPVSVPYMMDQTNFERVNGKFEHAGEVYRLVKQRYSNDTLTVVCIRDAHQKMINNALAEYAKTFSDNATDTESSKVTVSFLKDYISVPFAIRQVSPGWMQTVSYSVAIKGLIPSFFASIPHPPERA